MQICDIQVIFTISCFQCEAWVVFEFTIKSDIFIKLVEGRDELGFLSQRLSVPVKPCSNINFIETWQSQVVPNFYWQKNTILMNKWGQLLSCCLSWSEIRDRANTQLLLCERVQNNHHISHISMRSNRTLKNEYLYQQTQLTHYPQEQACQMEDKPQRCHHVWILVLNERISTPSPPFREKTVFDWPAWNDSVWTM